MNFGKVRIKFKNEAIRFRPSARFIMDFSYGIPVYPLILYNDIF
jgi:hypothetical protein